MFTYFVDGRRSGYDITSSVWYYSGLIRCFVTCRIRAIRPFYLVFEIRPVVKPFIRKKNFQCMKMNLSKKTHFHVTSFTPGKEVGFFSDYLSINATKDWNPYSLFKFVQLELLYKCLYIKLFNKPLSCWHGNLLPENKAATRNCRPLWSFVRGREWWGGCFSRQGNRMVFNSIWAFTFCNNF